MAATLFNMTSLVSPAIAAVPATMSSSRSSFSGASWRLQASLSPRAVATKARGPVSVTMMSKRTVEIEEIRGMSTDDIQDKVVDLKAQLFLLRNARATRKEFKPSEFSRIRKQVARMLTVRREREIEQKVSLRASRKLDRAWKASIVPRPPPAYNPAGEGN